MSQDLKLIRNFTIISHIDHGKSTLADRFLELTKTVPKEKLTEQYLDKMSLERERGITIKMHPCRLSLKSALDIYQLNLIDTPGHVDFSYEVSRALAAVEGAILLVDVTKGIQAQTIANLESAKKEGLVIISAVNKIDVAFDERVEEVKKEIADLLSVNPSEVLAVSGKKGIGIDNLFAQILKKVPSPSGSPEAPFKALIFDSKYDPFQGVVAYIRIFEGSVREGDKIYFLRKGVEGVAKEVGYFSPELHSTGKLSAGEIGYIKTGIREPERVRVGDTIIILKLASSASEKNIPVSPLAGYQEPREVVFTSLFPQEPTTFQDLRKSLEELHLSDPSFSFREIQRRVAQSQVSRGFQCGFLGLLHIEIVLERLKREFMLSIFIANPTTSYKITDEKGEERIISSAQDWPDSSSIRKIREPWAKIEIITPQKYFNDIFKLFTLFKINFLSSKSFGRDKLEIDCEMPFRKLIENFYDKLKSVSQGFASMNFAIEDFRIADVVKVDILIAQKKEASLSKIVEREEAYKEGKKIVEKLKEVFPQQLFPVALQAAIGGKIIARETVKALRKDVTAPLYGGDITRKRKLLEKQKKGKEKLAERGNITIPTDVIIRLLKE
ncbi:MAG: translation elongation factor 4 [Patescibacteria group bacterium]